MQLPALLQSFRLMRPLHVFVGSALAWSAIVVYFFWIGWEGGRTATDAYIPLRPLSANEAAALLTYRADSDFPGAVIAQITDQSVLLLTHYYLLPFKEDPVESPGMVSYGGSTYRIHSSSWEGYDNSHVVARGPLEIELGRRLSLQDVKASLAAKRSVSFASHHVWIYALVEILFLALVTLLAFVLFQKVGNGWMLVPAFTLIQVIIFAFVPAFSPAFLDADWFYQRVFVERLWIPNALLLTFSSGISFVVLLGVALSWMRRALNRLWGISARRYWSAVGVAMGLALMTLTAFDFAAFREEQAAAEKMFDRLQMAGLADGVGALRDVASPLPEYCDLYKQPLLSHEAMKRIDSLLDAREAGSKAMLSVFIPLDGERYLLLWNTGIFRYADVRKLKGPSGSRQINHDEIIHMLETGEAYRSGFMRFLKGAFLAGRPLIGKEGKIVAVSLVSPVNGRTTTNLGFVAGVATMPAYISLSSVGFVSHWVGERFWRAGTSR